MGRHNVKKMIVVLIMCILALNIFVSPSIILAQDNIKVCINGEELIFDVPPQIINGRTIVPARAISEAMACEVNWDSSSQTVYIEIPEAKHWNDFVNGYEEASKGKITQYELSTSSRLYVVGYITEVKVREIYDSKYDSVVMATIVDSNR